jgi:uncharacterized membrane protein YedE/YeeE
MNIAAQFTPWTSLAGGVLIGLSAGLFILLNGRISGISGLLGSLVAKQSDGRGEKFLFLLGLVIAPVIWSLATPIHEVALTGNAYALVIAGLLVGLGTRYGAGCTSGHGVCGLSRLSPRSAVAVCCFMAAGFATVFVLRHILGW